MKLNRFIALAAIALLVIGGMGTIATRSLAASKTAVSAQSQSCDQQDADTGESPGAADTDNVDLQCGEQVEDGQPDGAEGSEAAESTTNEADEAAALQSKAAISAADAESAALAANPGASVVKTELDDENGTVVYSVELSNSADVKVDATNGTILTTDSGANSEG
jgi:uncharacterized membrane protein YkoI